MPPYFSNSCSLTPIPCIFEHVAPLLDVRDLSIAFRTQADARPVVHGISFSIAPGEVLGLVGESGSGKSATSLAIMRLLAPNAQTTGEIRFNDSNLLTLAEPAMRAHRGRDIGMIFQEPMTALNPVMRVGEQVAEAVHAHDPGISRSNLRQRVLTAMQEVSLPDAERRMRDYPHQFSGGQRQRILIAMAIVNRPRLLIADEPTTALDVTVQAQILALLRKLRQQHGLAMLFISHDLAVISETVDRVAVMQRGHIVEEAPVARLFSAPQHRYTRSLLAAVPTMQTRRDLPLATVSA
jgi:peptide/nickel transport system ATP-binding protein